MKVILALDQGTSSSRAILFDCTGSVLAVAQKEFRQIYPRPGWVEHDPREIASTQLEVAAAAIGQVSGAEIAAIGITNQRETTILWDRVTGEPVANAIVWQDRRTAPLCEELRAAGYEALFRERTGLVLDPYFSGTKIRWLLDSVVGAGSRDRLAFGTVDTWLIWQLTGSLIHVTDVTNASRTLLFDIRRRQWDDELLDILRIPRGILPIVVSSSEVVGETAQGLPIPAGIPIAGIAGDQQAALFGQRCTVPGMAKNTYGTGCFIVMNTGDRFVSSPHGLLTTLTATGSPLPRAGEGGRRPGEGPVQRGIFALEGSVFIAGAAIQWLRDSLKIIGTAPEVEELAETVSDSGGVIFVPAFTGLGTPHWDPHARGAMFGITRGTTAAHIARAALEAIALQTAEVLDAMKADSAIDLKELRVDGAASTNNLLMQIQADMAGLRVVRSSISETTALGAAYLAGLATGVWRSEEEIDAQWKADRVFEPRIDESRRTALLKEWRDAIARIK
jgi:glycerol kinase